MARLAYPIITNAFMTADRRAQLSILIPGIALALRSSITMHNPATTVKGASSHWCLLDKPIDSDKFSVLFFTSPFGSINSTTLHPP